MPTQHRRQLAGHCGEHSAVRPGHLRPVHLATQYRDSVAEGEDLGVVQAEERPSRASQPSTRQEIK